MSALKKVAYGHLGIDCGLSILSAAIGFSISGELGVSDHLLMIAAGVATFLGSMAFIHGISALVTGPQRIPFTLFVTASRLLLASGYLSG